MNINDIEIVDESNQPTFMRTIEGPDTGKDGADGGGDDGGDGGGDDDPDAELTAEAEAAGLTLDEAKQAKAAGQTLAEFKAAKEADVNKDDNGDDGGDGGDGDDELDNLSDVEYTLRHLESTTGITLTDDELGLFAQAGLAEANFDDAENHPKFIKTLLDVFKTRNEDAFIGGLKPETVQVMNYLEKGGDITKYATAVQNDYSTIELSENDKDAHIDVMAKLLVEQSNGAIKPEQAKHLAKLDYTDGDGGFDKAKKALTELQAIGAAKVEKEIADATARETEAQQARAKAKADYTSLATGGKVKIGEQEYVIPEADRQKLINAKFTTFKDKNGKMYDSNGYATTDPNKAMSQLDVIKYQMNTSGDVLIDYFILSGGYKALAKRSADTFTSRFKRARQASEKGNGGNPTDTGRNKKGDVKHNILPSDLRNCTIEYN